MNLYMSERICFFGGGKGLPTGCWETAERFLEGSVQNVKSSLLS